MRALISNHLAVDGETWAQLFTAYHSGTYANQWMVLNLDRFRPGEDPQSGFLIVAEEVPGYLHYEDMTSHITVCLSFRYSFLMSSHTVASVVPRILDFVQ